LRANKITQPLWILRFGGIYFLKSGHIGIFFLFFGLNIGF
jgi:hypothetical protein